jgi:histidine ammonia-lyase
VESFDDHFSVLLNNVKKHNGQQVVAGAMRSILHDSKLIQKREDRLYNGKIEEKVFSQKIQEYYSLRCVPQILGPICDAIRNTEEVLLNEINSVNDNPIVDVESKNVYHGGNFHGDYVSYEMDKLKAGVTKLSMLAERQLNFLMNNKLNGILPPFANLGTLGLNLGMQGAQFTATSTTAENQTLSNPMYVHSIPSNNDNQDLVSMGTNSALITKKVIENTFQVLAIEFLTIIQAIDYLKIETKLSKKSFSTYEQLRKLVPVFTDDAPLYENLEKIKQHLQKVNPNIIS